MLELGLRPLGGNYATVRRRMAELGVSTTHWLGQAWLRGGSNTFHPLRPLSEMLRAGTRCQSAGLKERLIRAGLLKAICSNCQNGEWFGSPIPLELDHIDGDPMNNVLANLRLLCPNCHAQTPTYRALNAKYPHIPPLAEIERGIAAAGSIAKFAAVMGVSSDSVRGWLRSKRLRRMAKVGENGARYRWQARVVELVDTGDLEQLSAAGETPRM